MDTAVDAHVLVLATELFGRDEKRLHCFDVEDPFNDDLRLRGSSAKSGINIIVGSR